MTHMRVFVYQDLGTATEIDPYEGVCLSGFGHSHREDLGRAEGSSGVEEDVV